MFHKIASTLILVGCAIGLMPITAVAEQSKPMTIGDIAPPIDIAYWVKSDKLGKDEFRRDIFAQPDTLGKGSVTVLEFWATWCAPCKAGMPHLGELQEQYKKYGVTIIGISDEPLQTVVGWLASKEGADTVWYDRIHYTLATDPDMSVKKDYFTAAGQRGIPCAFIIGKDGRVEWIGHPARMDEALAAVVDGTWERESFKESWELEKAAERAQMEARKALADAAQAKDWDKALELLDGQIAAHPSAAGPMIEKFDILLVSMNEPERAYEFGEKLLVACWDNAMQLNSVAWMVADDKKVQTRNFDFAMKAAKRANELTGSKDAAILDTLARVYFEQGDLAGAVEWQTKAAAHAGDDQMGAEIKATLKKYKAAAPQDEKKADEVPEDDDF